MMNQFKGEKGFTLIELMIVIVVIGILATVAIPQITQVRDRARVSTVKSEFASIKPIMEMYYMDHDQYPDDLADLAAGNYTTAAVLQDTQGNDYDAVDAIDNDGEGQLTDPGGGGWQSYLIEYNQGGTIVELDSRTGEVEHR